MTERALKRRVAANFGSAAQRYHRAARLQRQTAALLIARMAEQPCVERLLDLGCGPGIGFSQLTPLCNSLIGLDLSEGMLAEARLVGGASLLQGDAEALPLADGSVERVYSNLALQWCPSLEQALAEIVRVLSVGGRAYLSTVLDGSLGELIQAWRQVDEYRHVNRFLTLDQLRACVDRVGCRAEVQQHTIQLGYQRVAQITRELKGLGANTVVEGGRPNALGQHDLQQLVLGYEPFRDANGVLPATWQIGLIEISK